jgi:hypothetical protein
MNSVLICLYDGYTCVYGVQPDLSSEQIAASFGDRLQAYKAFSSGDFPEATSYWPACFRIDADRVVFDLNTSKSQAKTRIDNQSAEQSEAARAGLPYDQFLVQLSLPPEQRLPEYQAAIDAVNDIAVETAARKAAVDSATNIQEVTAIVYPSES